jgi:hypothetical protein
MPHDGRLVRAIDDHVTAMTGPIRIARPTLTERAPLLFDAPPEATLTAQVGMAHGPRLAKIACP